MKLSSVCTFFSFLIFFSNSFAQKKPACAEFLIKSDAIYFSNPDSSYDLAQEAYNCANMEQDSATLAQALITFGKYHLLKAELNTAANDLNTAQLICLGLNDLKGLARIYKLKSILQGRLGNEEEGIELLLESKKIYEKLKDREGVISCLLNLSVNAIDVNKGEISETAFRQLDSLFDNLSETNRYFYYQNKGSYAFFNKQYHKAELLYTKALEISERQNMIDSKATIYMLLGKNAFKNGEYKKALNYLVKSEEICVDNKLDHELSETIDWLIPLHKALGNYEKALRYTEQNQDLKAKILNIEKLNQITSLEKKVLKAENEKKVEEEKLNTTKAEHKNQLLFYGIFFLLIVIALSIMLYNRTRNLKNKIHQKSNQIEEKQREILDSITYARFIQNTLLASNESFEKQFGSKNFFVLNKPKDIVSGDFYWMTEVEESGKQVFFLAVCDSTGHGVPGAFMSLLNIGFLSEAINERNITDPAKVFDYVRERLMKSISNTVQKDGFDGVLLKFTKDGNGYTVDYAAANNNPVLICNDVLKNLNYDKMPVGNGARMEPFKSYQFTVQKGDRVYIYTDGYADQFGGPKGKKFKYQQLEENIFDSRNSEPNEQLEFLHSKFMQWKGKLEQVDDVCVVGVRI